MPARKTAAARKTTAARKTAGAPTTDAAAKKKNGRLTGFTSHGQRYRSLALPRDVHEAIVERWPEGTEYEVKVAQDGAITARPVAR